MKDTSIHVCAKTASVILTTGIIFLLFTCMHFWVWEILRKMGGPHLHQMPMKWSAIAKSLRNIALTGHRMFMEVCQKNA
jgi:hypothetical protein